MWYLEQFKELCGRGVVVVVVVVLGMVVRGLVVLNGKEKKVK